MAASPPPPPAPPPPAVDPAPALSPPAATPAATEWTFSLEPRDQASPTAKRDAAHGAAVPAKILRDLALQVGGLPATLRPLEALVLPPALRAPEAKHAVRHIAPAAAKRSPETPPLSQLPPPNPLPDAPQSPSGLSGAFGGVAADSTFRTLSILVLLTLLLVPHLRQRIRVPVAVPRSVAFVSLLERPG